MTQDTKHPNPSSFSFCKTQDHLCKAWSLLAGSNFALEGGLSTRRATFRALYYQKAALKSFPITAN